MSVKPPHKTTKFNNLALCLQSSNLEGGLTFVLNFPNLMDVLIFFNSQNPVYHEIFLKDFSDFIVCFIQITGGFSVKE